MEVWGEAPRDLPGGDCLTWWSDENNAIVSQWRVSASSRNPHQLRRQQQQQQQCHTDLYRLLQKIQGLPATLPGLPLEITVLYNMVIFHVNVTGGFTEEHTRQIDGALIREPGHRDCLASGTACSTGLPAGNRDYLRYRDYLQIPGTEDL
ncbi:hypothetical protein FKM82_029234 [Ascaphus truei]